MPPLAVCADGVAEALESGGPLLGVIEDARFEVGMVRLEPGDSLVLHTDGIVEVHDGSGRWHDTKRLSGLVSQLRTCRAEEMIHRIVGAAREFTGAVDFQDDVTLVVVKREAGPRSPL